VRGLRRKSMEAIAKAQPFQNIDDLAQRLPELQKEEMTQLAAIGALNAIGAAHRREGLWQASRAVRPVGELLRSVPEPPQKSPLRQMNIEERLAADCHGAGMTIGRHPMAFRRTELNQLRVTPAAALSSIPNGHLVRVAGNVIVRQRPGTAKGILFISLEDETGISNVVIMPDLFERQRIEILNNPWLMVAGTLQNVDNVIHVLAQFISPLAHPVTISAASHDFR
jgi:error-prone DNA polymerase